MGQTTQQIERDIEKTRDDLGANLYELERQVKEIADWRHHFRNHPMSLMGLAFGGGVLLAAMTSGRSRYPSAIRSMIPPEPRSPRKRHAVETWDHIKDALIGVAASRVTDFVGEMVPGFADEYQRRVKPTLG